MNEWEVSKNGGSGIEWWNRKRLTSIRLVYLKDFKNKWMVDSNVVILPNSKLLIPPLFFKERQKALKIIMRDMKEIQE